MAYFDDVGPLTYIVASPGSPSPQAESRVGYPSAWLVAGPGQRLVEVEVPQDIGHDGSHEQQPS